MTVINNENNELTPTKTVTGWRMHIDYRKLNKATRKDHFPLSFIDKMLEKLARHSYLCYFDSYLGFFQIPIRPHDQEKSILICPYGTFDYRRMLFGFCDVPTTFQCCMQSIYFFILLRTSWKFSWTIFLSIAKISIFIYQICLWWYRDMKRWILC